MLSISLSILAIVGILVGLLTSNVKAKSKKLRRAAYIGSGVAILAVGIECARQIADASNHIAELTVAATRHEHVLQIHDSLRTELDSLRADNRQLQDMIAPVLILAKEKNPGASEASAIRQLLRDMSTRLSPKLIILPDRTVTERDSTSDLYVTSYVFRSQYPVSLRDARIELRLSSRVFNAKGQLPGSLPFKDNLTLTIHNDRLGVTFTARNLGEGGDMVLKVFTQDQPTILSSKLTP